jgi:hypothetical protein
LFALFSKDPNHRKPRNADIGVTGSCTHPDARRTTTEEEFAVREFQAFGNGRFS